MPKHKPEHMQQMKKEAKEQWQQPPTNAISLKKGALQFSKAFGNILQK